jgi:hypothetical protein
MELRRAEMFAIKTPEGLKKFHAANCTGGGRPLSLAERNRSVINIHHSVFIPLIPSSSPHPLWEGIRGSGGDTGDDKEKY